MGYHISSELLQKYFRGECTEKEAEAISGWIANPENEHMLLRMMQAHWEQLEPGVSTNDPDLEKSLHAIHQRINPSLSVWPAPRAQDLQEKGTGEERPATLLYRQWLRIAAGLLVPVILAVGYFYTRPGISPAAETVVMREKAIPATQQSKLLLPDGSEVWLNYASKLQYPECFDGEIREVYLEGEAFFNVVKDPDKPFVVHAKGIDVKVLGTSFNVKSYAEDETVETTLATGKVLIEDNLSDAGVAGKVAIALAPDQKASYSKATGQIVIDRVDIRHHIAWKEDILLFRNEPYPNVLKQLERRFGVNVHLPAGTTGDCGFTGKFQSESLEEILEVIKSTSYIEYTLSGNLVRIKGNFCE